MYTHSDSGTEDEDEDYAYRYAFAVDSLLAVPHHESDSSGNTDDIRVCSALW